MIDLESKFLHVYNNNLFGGIESVSGPGSGLEQTKIISVEIPTLIKNYGIRSVIDAPCGDLYWMAPMISSGVFEFYTGVDIVKDMIEKNRHKFSSERINFEQKNIVTDILSLNDLILCRDCFVHLSFDDIIRSIINFKKSGSKYLLTTTFLKHWNADPDGKDFWRPINLESTPFNFPPPLEIINEGCTEGDGGYTDKSLALWDLNNIMITESGQEFDFLRFFQTIYARK